MGLFLVMDAQPDIAPAVAGARKHKWDRDKERRIAAIDCPDGNERTERDCVSCGLVKITVHPPHGFPWREWRTKDGGKWVGAGTPPCLGGGA